jgi:DNA-binding transcriptional LysR family regulator
MLLSDQIRYFAAAARHEHLGRAADELDMSQPALSRSIFKLEQAIGVQLFDRAGRGVRLNSAGKILLERIERAHAECEDAVRELREQRNSSRNSISIGYFATFGVRLIPELVKSFCEIDTTVQFQLFEGPSPLLSEQLISGAIDLCVASQFTDAGLAWQPLFGEELFALVPPGHRFATKASLDLAELAEEPFVALKAGHALRRTLEDLCAEAGFTPQIKLEGYEVATLRGLVGAGFGVTLSPRRTVAAPVQAVSIPVRKPQCRRSIGLSWRKGRWLSPKTLAFKDHLVKNLSVARARLEKG